MAEVKKVRTSHPSIRALEAAYFQGLLAGQMKKRSLTAVGNSIEIDRVPLGFLAGLISGVRITLD